MSLTLSKASVLDVSGNLLNSSWFTILQALGSRDLDVSNNSFGGTLPPLTGAHAHAAAAPAGVRVP